MRRFQNASMIVSTISIMITIVSYSASDGGVRNQVIGRWESTAALSATQTYDFTKDGKVNYYHSIGNYNDTGQYQFLDDNHVRIAFPQNFGIPQGIFEVSISGNVLKLTSQDGKAMSWFRMK